MSITELNISILFDEFQIIESTAMLKVICALNYPWHEFLMQNLPVSLCSNKIDP